MKQYTITSASDLPADFGPLRRARKTTTVKTREPNAPAEEFKKSWGTLTGVPGQDLVLFSDADPLGYPCKIEIFKETYEEAAPGSGNYRKKETSQLVQVPAGAEALVKTLEGDVTVRHPDWIVIGKKGEAYANRADWVEKNLEFID